MDRFRRYERAKEVPKIVRQRVQLKPDRVGVERATRKACPFDRALAFPYPLLGHPTLIIEADDILRCVPQVRDDEADAREQLPGMPLKARLVTP